MRALSCGTTAVADRRTHSAHHASSRLAPRAVTHGTTGLELGLNENKFDASRDLRPRGADATWVVTLDHWQADAATQRLHTAYDPASQVLLRTTHQRFTRARRSTRSPNENVAASHHRWRDWVTVLVESHCEERVDCSPDLVVVRVKNCRNYLRVNLFDQSGQWYENKHQFFVTIRWRAFGNMETSICKTSAVCGFACAGDIRGSEGESISFSGRSRHEAKKTDSCRCAEQFKRPELAANRDPDPSSGTSAKVWQKKPTTGRSRPAAPAGSLHCGVGRRLLLL